MFEVGEKVKCVDDRFPTGINDIMNALPRVGEVYTVRDIVPGINYDNSGTFAVMLKELVNMPNQHGIEPGFNHARFSNEDMELTESESYAESLNDEGCIRLLEAIFESPYSEGDDEGEEWKSEN